MPRRNKSIKYLPIAFPNGCDLKRKFSSKYLAGETAEYQMLINPTLQLFVYQCDLCHKWHLTRRSNITN